MTITKKRAPITRKCVRFFMATHSQAHAVTSQTFATECAGVLTNGNVAGV